MSGRLPSFPAMGTWIEIIPVDCSFCKTQVVPCNGNVDWNMKFSAGHWWQTRRSLQWERGLKYRLQDTGIHLLRRSLQWERGLKCKAEVIVHCLSRSFPAMGTWIEMLRLWVWVSLCCVVPCNGNVDWNCMEHQKTSPPTGSFPAMGTWIEIIP